MISTYPKIREAHERRVNRTCAVACAWVSAVPSIFGFFLILRGQSPFATVYNILQNVVSSGD